MRTMVQRHVEALKPRWVELTAATFSAPQACACLKSISLSIEDAIAKRLRDSSPGAAETGREPSPDRAGADAEYARAATRDQVTVNEHGTARAVARCSGNWEVKIQSCSLESGAAV